MIGQDYKTPNWIVNGNDLCKHKLFLILAKAYILLCGIVRYMFRDIIPFRAELDIKCECRFFYRVHEN